jgi:hypothetical protein
MRKLLINLVFLASLATAISACSYLPTMPWDHSSYNNGVIPGAETLSTKNEGVKASENLGELHYQVESEHLARARGCDIAPIARLLEKGPGYETYTVPCGNAQMMVIRCDFSYCRANS